MITFFILTFIFLYIYQKNYKEIGSVLLLSFAFSLAIYILFVAEHLIGNIDYFISDEVHYVQQLDDNSGDRLLWFIINYVILSFDIFGGLGVKLINIPLLQIFIIYLWKIFNKKRIILFISFIFPYLALIATKDLRDILIYLSTTLIVYYFDNLKVYSFFYSILLFLLRPVMAIITLIVSILYFYKILPIKFKTKIRKTTLYIISASFLILFITINTKNPIQRKINSVMYALEYKIDHGPWQARTLELVKTDKYVTGNYFHDGTIGLVRYILTPIPTSLLNRILEGGSKQWGIIDDIVRFFNQISYFILLFYLLLHPFTVFRLFKKYNIKQKVLLYSLLIYWPLYSFHLQGVTNQRQKLPFQIAVFLISISVYYYKRKKIVFKRK